MKSIITSLVLLFTLVGFSQKTFQGKAVYMTKTSVDMSAWGGQQMSEQRKKQIMDRMKNFLEKTFVLTFDKTSSVYKEEGKLAAPGAGNSRWGGTSQGSIYKNTKEGKVIEETEFFGKKFLISDDGAKPDWKLSADTKKIGNYICYKATYERINNDFDWTSMRRRPNTETKKDSTTTKKEAVRKELVTAWYSPQIPVSNGPDDFWGLPGLILEVSAGNTTILCTEIVLNPSDKIEISVPTRGQKISRDDYNKTVKKKTEEMRDRFRNSRGGGRRF